MAFHTLVEEIQQLSVSEKEEMRGLLDKFIAEERRAEIAASYREAQEEHDRGDLVFSSDPAALRRQLID